MTSAREPLPDPIPPPSVPPPLTAAVSLAAFEAVVLALQAFVQVPGMQGEKLAMNVTTFLFFLIYAAALGFCSWRLYRLQSWARAPVVLAQLIQILVGASFWGGGTTVVAVVSIAVALVVLLGIFHPDSLAALEAPQ